MSSVTTLDPPKPKSEYGSKRRLLWLAILMLTLAGLWLIGRRWVTSAQDVEEWLSEARRAYTRRDYETAEHWAKKSFERDPERGEAVLLAARSAVAQNGQARAIDYLNQLKSSAPDVRLEGSLLRASVSLEGLGRFSSAEVAFREALKIDSNHVPANEGLARLLGICGRRREAIPHVLKLIQQEQETDLVILLTRSGGMIDEPDLLRSARRQSPEDPLPLVGLARLELNRGELEKALALIEESLRLSADVEEAYVLKAEILMSLQRIPQASRWMRTLPDSVFDRPEIWLIRARLADRFQDVDGAIRAYWESAKRQPEHRTPPARLAELLSTRGRDEQAERFARHLNRILELEQKFDAMFQSRHQTIAPLLEVVEACANVGRLWEAYAWCRMAVELDPSNELLARRALELREQLASLPLRQTTDVANVAMSIDLSEFPEPHFNPIRESTPREPIESNRVIRFREEAAEVGLNFLYHRGTTGPPRRLMYEFTGGGIAAIDYDLDGWPDLFFTQGTDWPPEASVRNDSDRLFHNRFGARFMEITAKAGIAETRFGQGVAVGDFDSDGFPDLFVANLGKNQLWRNNGDGTFDDVTRAAGIEGDRWSTSVIMADLDGDGFTDLYIANYLKGEDLFERVCKHPKGGDVLCFPFQFDGETDQFLRNQGQGTFEDVTDTLLSTQPNGKGLGVAAWDADGSGRLSLLVANDTTPNMFFVPETDASGKFQLTERGILSGIAVNSEGKAEGSMGISLGDVNNDGRLDVHVTNFLQESNTLYMASSDLLFRDRTHEVGLHHSTLNLLGFGTQFLDADLDGTPELFVANGHVDNLREYGRPYQMRPQFFQYAAGRFEEFPAEILGPYFQTELLGRAALKIDWNQDGREDLVVGHLDSEYALLTNATPGSGEYIQLRLIGVISNRDAIGTTAVVRAGGQTWTRQLTAGESYQSCNQNRLTFGLGRHSKIDELIVRWPSGAEQRFSDVPISRVHMLVEGRSMRSVD